MSPGAAVIAEGPPQAVLRKRRGHLGPQPDSFLAGEDVRVRQDGSGNYSAQYATKQGGPEPVFEASGTPGVHSARPRAAREAPGGRRALEDDGRQAQAAPGHKQARVEAGGAGGHVERWGVQVGALGLGMRPAPPRPGLSAAQARHDARQESRARRPGGGRGRSKGCEIRPGAGAGGKRARAGGAVGPGEWRRRHGLQAGRADVSGVETSWGWMGSERICFAQRAWRWAAAI